MWSCSFNASIVYSWKINLIISKENSHGRTNAFSQIETGLIIYEVPIWTQDQDISVMELAHTTVYTVLLAMFFLTISKLVLSLKCDSIYFFFYFFYT